MCHGPLGTTRWERPDGKESGNLRLNLSTGGHILCTRLEPAFPPLCSLLSWRSSLEMETPEERLGGGL